MFLKAISITLSTANPVLMTGGGSW